MYYDNHEMSKNDPEYKKKKHNEAKRRRQYLQQCPICGLYREFITNVHCVQEHEMTKKEVEEKYGKIVVTSNRKRVKQNG